MDTKTKNQKNIFCSQELLKLILKRLGPHSNWSPSLIPLLPTIQQQADRLCYTASYTHNSHNSPKRISWKHFDKITCHGNESSTKRADTMSWLIHVQQNKTAHSIFMEKNLISFRSFTQLRVSKVNTYQLKFSEMSSHQWGRGLWSAAEQNVTYIAVAMAKSSSKYNAPVDALSILLSPNRGSRGKIYIKELMESAHTNESHRPFNSSAI